MTKFDYVLTMSNYEYILISCDYVLTMFDHVLCDYAWLAVTLYDYVGLCICVILSH